MVVWFTAISELYFQIFPWRFETYSHNKKDWTMQKARWLGQLTNFPWQQLAATVLSPFVCYLSFISSFTDALQDDAGFDLWQLKFSQQAELKLEDPSSQGGYIW